jgi:general secretion pathway protein J
MTLESCSARKSAPASSEANDAGWTLIELLIGLVLMSLIAILVTNSIFSSRQAIDQAQIRNGEISIEAVETYLRHALSEAQPIKRVGSPINSPLIDAGPERLRLITAFAPAGQFSGLYSIELGLVPSETSRGYDLVEIRTLYRPSPEQGQPEPERPSMRSRLVRNVGAIRFRYFGIRDEKQLQPEWFDDWSHPSKLPDLVEVKVAFPRGDGRRWSPMIIALPIGR